MYKLNEETIFSKVKNHDISSKSLNKSLESVFDRFKQSNCSNMAEDIKEKLKWMSFNNWHYSDGELLNCIRQMFIELKIVQHLKIDISVVEEWLQEVYIHYNKVPFHNFKHCFAVTQMMYAFVNTLNLQQQLDITSITILLVAAICHDLDHPGLNNNYQINAQTELALRYNDASPLENHHSSIAFHILSNPRYNLLQKLSREEYQFIRAGIIKCILSTDMSKHDEILNNFRSIIPHFDFNNNEHKEMLWMILIKSADVSNELRPLDVSKPWLDLLFEEYFKQSDMERSKNLPLTPYMDKEKICIASSQVNFINFVLLPLFEALTSLFQHSRRLILFPVQEALEHYKNVDITNKLQSTVPKNISSQSSKTVLNHSPM